MHRTRFSSKSHFTVHIAQHLFGVVALFVFALALGMVSKSVGLPSSSLLALTTSGLWSTTTTNSALSASFSVERIAIACGDGVTHAKYHFTISPENSGFIFVSSALGTDYIYTNDGRGLDRYFAVGSYTWQGSPLGGYAGTNYGTFSVENVCLAGVQPQPSTTTTTGSGTISVPPMETLVSVAFSVQPGPVATCSATAAPLTPVFFVVTRPAGGEFIVSSDTGVRNAHFVWGEHYFPNGVYSWSALVKPGFEGEGSLSGTFEIHNSCTNNTPQEDTPQSTSPLGTTIATTSSVSIEKDTRNTLALPPLPRPQLNLFLDNTPVAKGRIFNKEEVEFRIATAIASSVEIFSTQGVLGPKLLARAVKDDLLSEPGLDVWSYVLDMSTLAEGATKLHVRVKHTDERETISEYMSIMVKHPTVTTRTLLLPNSLPITEAREGGGGIVETSVRVSTEERKAVLARVSDPSSCTNAEECKIYCRSLPGIDDLCASFAQEQFVLTLPTGESLADDIPISYLAELLVGGAKYSPLLPEYVSGTAELKQYCGETVNSALCAKVFLDNGLSTSDALQKKKEHIMRSQEEQRTVLVERIGTRAYVDTDADGVTDYDEINIYHTDAQNGDTDQDGFTDGAELLARTNPSGGMRIATGFGTSAPVIAASTDESVPFVNPMISGKTEHTLLTVKNVEVYEVATTTEGEVTARKLKFAGTALPNTFVTLYIFSEPIVVTVKADGAGAWVYTLDKELPDGTHQVYSTLTDAGGRILAKSEPLPFVKQAAAVSLGSALLTPEATQPGFFTGASLYAMLAILVGILGIALSIIGFIVKQKSAHESTDLPGI